MLSDDEIIDVRKATKAKTTTPWSDTLAFARAIEAAVLAKMQAQEPVEPLPDIWYMHDNHAFTKLEGTVENMLIQLEALCNDGCSYGMLCSKREGFPNVHQGSRNDRANFLANCREVLEKHVPTAPVQQEPTTSHSAKRSADSAESFCNDEMEGTGDYQHVCNGRFVIGVRGEVCGWCGKELG